MLVKPTAGGGGIGMVIVNNEDELPQALASARKIALSTFGNGDLYIEKYLVNPRHIEFQILGDAHGNVVHLGGTGMLHPAPSSEINRRIAFSGFDPPASGRDGRDGCQDCQIGKI